MVLTHFGLNVAFDFNHQGPKQGMVFLSWVGLDGLVLLLFNYNFYFEEARENSG